MCGGRQTGSGPPTSGVCFQVPAAGFLVTKAEGGRDLSQQQEELVDLIKKKKKQKKQLPCCIYKRGRPSTLTATHTHTHAASLISPPCCVCQPTMKAATTTTTATAAAPACRACGSHGPFYACYLQHSNYLCSTCACTAVLRHRRADASRLLSHRLYNALRRQGWSVPELSRPSCVRRLLKRWRGRSVLSGVRDSPANLCILPYYRELPPAEWHCVLLTQQEARSLAHMREEAAAHARFPAWLQQEMEKQRAAHTA